MRPHWESDYPGYHWGFAGGNLRASLPSPPRLLNVPTMANDLDRRNTQWTWDKWHWYASLWYFQQLEWAEIGLPDFLRQLHAQLGDDPLDFDAGNAENVALGDDVERDDDAEENEQLGRRTAGDRVSPLVDDRQQQGVGQPGHGRDRHHPGKWNVRLATEELPQLHDFSRPSDGRPTRLKLRRVS